ncbi:Fe2+-dependent dioxygenase [Bradyrhizobium prioriisuperbiae]|uniref:Fe2+-dependent dioxygenase n=1 Tax=Bradyrhizobium prioriisuperbiae TaxID=2854389 RepID=UPI0028E75FE2|nr:Fe2+-dependent dioxygenase [Bradyrhizobium prioritasuperba]
MFTTIDNVLSADELARLRMLARAALFEDGRGSATGLARELKHNEQMRPDGEAAAEAERILTDALLGCDALRGFAIPAAMQRPRLSRYGVGMSYGTHVDSAFMGEPTVRSDVSVTLFLSDPDTYDGGELAIDGPWGRFNVKLNAGSLVAYPATTLHQVIPVSRGERLVALTWITSRVRSHDQREILVEVERLRGLIEGGGEIGATSAVLAKIRENLHRMWFDP